MILRKLISTSLFFPLLALLKLTNGSLACSRLTSELFVLGASLAIVG